MTEALSSIRIVEPTDERGNWIVTVDDPANSIVTFSGPDARENASEYARFLASRHRRDLAWLWSA